MMKRTLTIIAGVSFVLVLFAPLAEAKSKDGGGGFPKVSTSTLITVSGIIKGSDTGDFGLPDVRVKVRDNEGGIGSLGKTSTDANGAYSTANLEGAEEGKIVQQGRYTDFVKRKSGYIARVNTLWMPYQDTYNHSPRLSAK